MENFNIHDWQAKQRLVENDNEFKRLRYSSEFKFLDGLKADNKINRWGISSLQTQFGLSDEKAIEIFNLYTSSLREHHQGYDENILNLSIGEFLTILQHEDMNAYDAVEGYIEKYIPESGPEDEIDEASQAGTGASFDAGVGEGYATPNSFAKKDKRKNKKTKYQQ